MKNQSPTLKTIIRILTLAAATLGIASAAHAGSVLTVSSNPTTCFGQYASIQQAIDASKPGDLILVCPGTYYDAPVIDQYHSNITVQGITSNDQNQVVIMPPGPFSELPPSTIVTVVSTKNVTLRNLTIDGSLISSCAGLNLIGVHYANASGAMEGLTVRNLNAPCIPMAIEVDGVPNHVDITDCNLHDFRNNGIFVSGNNVDVSIKRNVISGPGVDDAQQYGILVQNGAKANIDGNVITFGNCVASNGCGAQSPEGADIAVNVDNAQITNNVLGRNKYNLRVGANNCDIHGNTIFDSYSAFAVLLLGNSNNVSNNSIFHTAQTAIYIDGNGNTIHKNVINEAVRGIQAIGRNNNFGSRLRSIRGIPVEPTANSFFNVQNNGISSSPD